MSEELFDIISQTLLWECASKKVEEPAGLGEMLKDINYLDDKEEILEQITKLEVIDSDSFDVTDLSHEESEINVIFEMPFIMSASVNDQYIWRISGSVTGVCVIPDGDKFEWSVFDWGSMNKEELLSYSDIPRFEKLKYDVECDTYY